MRIANDIDPAVLRLRYYMWKTEDDDPSRNEYSEFTDLHVMSIVLLRRVQARLGCTEDHAALEVRAAVAEGRTHIVEGAPETMSTIEWLACEVEGVPETAGVIIAAADEHSVYPNLIAQQADELRDMWRRVAAQRARA